MECIYGFFIQFSTVMPLLRAIRSDNPRGSLRLYYSKEMVLRQAVCVYILYPVIYSGNTWFSVPYTSIPKLDIDAQMCKFAVYPLLTNVHIL